MNSKGPKKVPVLYGSSDTFCQNSAIILKSSNEASLKFNFYELEKTYKIVGKKHLKCIESQCSMYTAGRFVCHFTQYNSLRRSGCVTSMMMPRPCPSSSRQLRSRAGHHHGSHTPTSPEAILLGKMAYHTKQIRRECTTIFLSRHENFMCTNLWYIPNKVCTEILFWEFL